MTAIMMDNHGERREDVVELWPNEYLTDKNADLRNELCLKCGRYKLAHDGACDWCRWKKGE